MLKEYVSEVPNEAIKALNTFEKPTIII